MPIQPFSRSQLTLLFEELFPLRDDNRCACGCEEPLTGRKKRWASSACTNKASTEFNIRKGVIAVIRYELLKRDGPTCRHCGITDLKKEEWQADHIIPVHLGGGGCGLENYQILCLECHFDKSALETTNRCQKEV